MNDDQLRALVRAAVAKHLGQSDRAGSMAAPVVPALLSDAPMPPAPAATILAGAHSSHAVYLALVNASDACVIEPGVPCNHCNYCRSHGH